MTARADLRAATPGDVAAITKLVRSAYSKYIERIGREPAPMGADYSALVDAGEVWVAEHDGRLVGVVVLAIEPDHLQLDNIAVAPEVQGLGIGAQLLELADREALRQGRAEVRLYTNEQMTENLAYYPRHGYQETHRGSADGFNRVYFTKQVAGGA
jgi:ribosomal protein S18 acetylase RimI-like enzyme